MSAPPPVATDATNPDAYVICAVCEALPAAERKRRRDQITVRMLGDGTSERPRRRA